jgi:hypothetical protein
MPKRIIWFSEKLTNIRAIKYIQWRYDRGFERGRVGVQYTDRMTGASIGYTFRARILGKTESVYFHAE